MDKYFSKEYLPKVNKYMKRCSKSLSVREMQIKATIRYHFIPLHTRMAADTSLKAHMVKKSACNAGDLGSIPGESPGKIPWRRKWQPTSVFLPGKSHGQRRLAGYSPWVAESDMTEQLSIQSN